MSNTSSNELSTTIANMLELINLPKARRKSEMPSSRDLLSPLKRRLSSESTETPDKRPRTESSLDVSWISSPRENDRMRRELVEARTEIVKLQKHVSHMHKVRKELQIMFDNEITTYQHEQQRDKKHIEELENHLQSIRKREHELREEVDNVKKEWSISKIDYESKIDKLESEKSKLQSDVNISRSEETDEVAHLKTDIQALEVKLEAAKVEEQKQKEFIKELRANLSKLSSVERENELKNEALVEADLKIKDLEYKISSFGEWEQQAKIQHERLLAYPELERDVLKLREDCRNLREEVRNKLILEEEVHDLKKKLENYREHDKKLASMEASHAHLENLVEDWRFIVKELCEINVPDSLLSKQMRQCIEKLQQQELSLTTEKVQLESQLKSCQHELKHVKQELERHVKQMSDLQNTQQQHQMLMHRFQKKLTLVSRERDSYRMQLDSYEKDLTINVNAQNPAQSSVYKERMENLEKIVEGYREMVTNLENELRKTQPDLAVESPVRSEQLNRLQDEILKLQNENARLSERCDELSIRLEQELIGKDEIKGKILHFKINPLSEIVAERESNVEKLQAEVDRLKRKIVNLEEGIDSSKLGESMCSSREVQSLREQVKSSEIKMQRLKEYFKTSSHEFRNVCYMLLGYKIDRVSSSQYKLSSMYAEAAEDCLEFQLKPDGNLNLLETQFSSTLEDMIDLHLRHQSSIPVFLSAVTMDLFNRTTMPTKPYME